MTTQLIHPRCGHTTEILPNQIFSHTKITTIDPESGARVHETKSSPFVCLLCPSCVRAKSSAIDAFYTTLRKHLKRYRTFWLQFRTGNTNDDESIRQGIVKARLAINAQLKERTRRMCWAKLNLFMKEIFEVDIVREKVEHEEKLNDLLWGINGERIWYLDIRDILWNSYEDDEDEDEESDSESEWEDVTEEDTRVPSEGDALQDNGPRPAADGA